MAVLTDFINKPKSEKLPFLKKAANILLPKLLEFQSKVPLLEFQLQKSPVMEFRVGEGLTPEQQIKAEEIIRKPTERIGTLIKLPFIPKEVVAPKSFIAETVKGFTEIPETVITSLKQAPAIIKSGGKIPPPPISRQRFDLKTYAEQTEELINKGVGPLIASLWVGSTAIMDTAIMGGAIRSGAEAIKRNIPLPDSSVQAAMQSMGLKEGFTEAERKKAFREISHILHPDKKTGSQAAFQQLNNANEILKKASTQKISPLLRPLRTAAEKLTAPISEIGKPIAQQPFLGVRGLLPIEAGTIPTQPFAKPKLRFGLRGLEIQEFPAKKIPPQEIIKPKGVSEPVLPVKTSPVAKQSVKSPIGHENLTAKFLEYAKGKKILSRQEIIDFAKRPELKKGEADLLLKKLGEFEGMSQISIKKLEIPEFNNGKEVGGWDDIYRTSDAKTKDKMDKDINYLLKDKNNELEPILINKDGKILDVVDGHHRVASYLSAGREDIPIQTTSSKLPAQEFADSIRREMSARGITPELEKKEPDKFREFNRLPFNEQEKAFDKLDPKDKAKVFNLEISKSNRDLIKTIKELGGIKSFKGGFLSEELKPLPIIVRSRNGVTVDEMLDMLRDRGFNFENEAELIDALTTKTTILKDKTFKPISDEVVKNTKEYDIISEDLKKRIKTFFTPSRKQKSRPFHLLGNKDSTIDLFSFVIEKWVQEHGVEVFIEPYAGAFTLGTHALENAINNGLKEYHGNIFDKEKFTIVKEIEGGNVEKVKELLNKAPILLTQEIRKHAIGKQKEILDNFFAENPDSYVGSDAFLNYIRNLPEGSQVTVYKDVYEPWQKIFNASYKAFVPREVSSIEDAIKKVLIHNTGVFSGTGQSLIRTHGFTSFENKLFGKFGTRDGFDDINRIFNLAKEKGTRMFIENKDGVEFINGINTRPIKTAYYLDPPYIKSNAIYSLEKFADIRQFIETHKKVFEQMADGAQGAFTNDIVEEYLKDMESMIPDSKLFAYKEKNTPTSLVTNKETGELVDRFLVEYKNKERKTERPEIVKIKELKKEKQLSNLTVSRIRKGLGITELKNATKTQIDQLISFLEELRQGDKLLTPKQMEGLKDLVESAEFNNPLELITQREVQEKFRDKFDDIMGTGLVKYIENVFFPTVEIKEGNPVIKKVVNRGDLELDAANKEVERRDNEFNEMLEVAEKSRKLPLFEKLKQMVVPQNREIFQALSGEKISLTREEVAVVAYLKNFFAKVKTDLNLSKYRKYYVPHLGQKFMEKMITLGPRQAIIEIFKTKDANIPLNIMLELDNIIGGKKFFKFALERKGGLIPTTNLRRIIHEYSNLYETKKALDRFLPEGQAVTQLLLKDKSAIWMKQFLQNLKGRGLDSKFRHGKMGWLPRIADRIVSITYVQLLGFNYRSTLKNLIAGETNSIIYQDFIKYLTGKKRALEHPKKLYRMATEFSIFEGTFAEYVEKGIGGLKRYSDILMFGQRAGEYEIRGTIFASELTEEEWMGEKISPQRIREIKDIIAITQGLFSKIDSPLWVQTWYGRMFTQMNRWRVTNALMFRRILNGVIKEQKAGIHVGINSRRMSKMFLMYAISLWVSYEFGKAGYKEARKIAKSAGEVINNLIEIVTLKAITDAITDNVTFSSFKRLTYDLQMLASYIHLLDAPSRIRFQNGLRGIYIAPVETGKKLFGIEKDKKKKTISDFLKNKSIIKGKNTKKTISDFLK